MEGSGGRYAFFYLCFVCLGYFGCAYCFVWFVLEFERDLHTSIEMSQMLSEPSIRRASCTTPCPT